MTVSSEKKSNRYINDLHRLNFDYGNLNKTRRRFLPYALAAIFLAAAGVFGNMSLQVTNEELVMLIAASVNGGYMALNIGANDVANNIGPAVGGKVLTVTVAIFSLLHFLGSSA